MKFFVEPNSIVRKIWGNADTVLFIFGGAAAEFALNKAVDWLYFTGKLPKDPIGRLFSTLHYAHRILFEEESKALQVIRSIRQVHQHVEAGRGYAIPAWAYRDVLYMLIHYTIASYELLERKLSDAEKEEIFDVFYRLGKEMDLEELPTDYKQWLVSRQEHLNHNLAFGKLSQDLFEQYKKHLGSFRYNVLLQVQKQMVPVQVNKLLKFKGPGLYKLLIDVYRPVKHFSVSKEIKFRLLPAAYRKQLRAIDRA